MMRYIFLIVFLTFSSSNSALSQPKSARSKYGPYPIGGTSLSLLKKDLAIDAKLLKSNKPKCKSISVQSKAKNSFCDFDSDKITNQMERKLGLKTKSKDSDSDSLADRTELLKYHTNPLNADTDGDGYLDADEIFIYHTDPLIPDVPGVCATPNFDEAGNTKSFGIAPLNGNKVEGDSQYSQKCSTCHMGSEKGTTLNFSELRKRISESPMFIMQSNLDDQSLAHIVAYLHRMDLGGSGNCNPNNGITPVPSGTPTPSSQYCPNTYFDSLGNTQQFGISTSNSSLVGNISRGAAYYANNCSSCHGSHGDNFTMQQLIDSVTGPSMRIMNVQLADYADLTAYNNRSKADTSCLGTPTPTPISNGPTPTSTPTPFTAQCSNQYFDAMGNTSSFGIPSATSGQAQVMGNLDRGRNYYSNCIGACHSPEGITRGNDFTYSQLKTAVEGGSMKIQGLSVQTLADLTAWTNRSKAPQNCPTSGTPTPTPTPLSQSEQGKILFTNLCVRCHTISSSLQVKDIDTKPSVSKIHSALWSGPDEMPTFRDMTNGQTAPPYTSAEMALWSYLNTLN